MTKQTSSLLGFSSIIISGEQFELLIVRAQLGVGGAIEQVSTKLVTVIQKRSQLDKKRCFTKKITVFHAKFWFYLWIWFRSV